MRRGFWTVLLAMLAALALPATNALAANSASVTLSVTIPPTPLLARAEPGCDFVITEATRSATCALTILMAQPTLELNGWRLSLSASGAVNSATGATLPASALQIDALTSIVATSGQAIDQVGGPYLPSNAAHRPLDAAQAVAMAEPGFGNGAYTAIISVRLTVPVDAAPGTYLPVWTLSVANNAL